MPIIVESVDDRVKLQLGELLLSNIALQDALDQANQKIAMLEGPKDMTETPVKKQPAKPA